MKNTIKKLYLLILFITLFSVFNCTGEPVLSILNDQKIQLILKGTYESNNPFDWQTNVYKDESLTDGATGLDSDLATSDLQFYIDIAEVRISTGTDQGDILSEDYWEMFAKNRHLLCSQYEADYSKIFDTCQEQSGVARLSQFFNEGFTYEAVDVPAGHYPHLGVYFRNFVTAPSGYYESDGTLTEESKTSFDNRTVSGYNIENLYQYASTDYENETPLMFPLANNTLDLNFNNNEDPVVLEVRIFVKNLIMKHRRNLVSDDLTTEHIFYGPSDIIRNHVYNDELITSKMGGNFLITARNYNPENVGNIAISNSGAVPAHTYYWAVVKEGSTFSPESPTLQMPLAATRGGTNETINNLPPASYDLYLTCDEKKYETAGEVAGQDGYPETAVSCGTFGVSANVSTAANVSCTCP